MQRVTAVGSPGGAKTTRPAAAGREVQFAALAEGAKVLCPRDYRVALFSLGEGRAQNSQTVACRLRVGVARRLLQRTAAAARGGSGRSDGGPGAAARTLCGAEHSADAPSRCDAPPPPSPPCRASCPAPQAPQEGDAGLDRSGRDRTILDRAGPDGPDGPRSGSADIRTAQRALSRSRSATGAAGLAAPVSVQARWCRYWATKSQPTSCA